MAKDPAFLYYDGDASKDMSHMSRTERGAYIDIVHAQKKFGRLSLEIIKKVLSKDFEDCWPSLRLVMNFEDDKYYIEWLEASIDKRKSFTESRRKNRTKKDMSNICSTYDNHMNNISTTYVEHMENEIENKEVIEDKGGMGGKEVIPQMLNIFCRKMPTYLKDQQRDAPELLKIAQIITGKNLPTYEFLEEWESIVDFISKDSFYMSFSIKQINNNIQGILQKKYNNGSKINRGNTSSGNVQGTGGY